jgi:hypothetical protein
MAEEKADNGVAATLENALLLNADIGRPGEGAKATALYRTKNEYCIVSGDWDEKAEAYKVTSISKGLKEADAQQQLQAALGNTFNWREWEHYGALYAYNKPYVPRWA